MESVQGRDGAVSVPGSIGQVYLWRCHVLADRGYAGDELHNVLAGSDDWAIECAKCPDRAE